MAGVHHRLHQRHGAVVMGRRHPDAVRFQRRQQLGHPRPPRRQPGLAHGQHAATQARRLGRGRHRMQAHHLGPGTQHCFDGCDLHRSDVQPQAPRFPPGRPGHPVPDHRRRLPDGGGKQQHVALLQQHILVAGTWVSRIVPQHLKPHAVVEECTQPATVRTGAADDANNGGDVTVQRKTPG